MLKYGVLILSISLIANGYTHAQFNERYQDISKKDIVQALQFAGVDIFDFKVNSHKRNYDFFVTLDEYDSTHGLRRIDTLLAYETQYRRYSAPTKYSTAFIDRIQIFTKVLNNNYDSVYLYIETDNIATWKTLHVAYQFAKKHYWIRFKGQQTVIGKDIPLLFFGSEWTEVINGVLTPRFCSARELEPSLSDPVIKRVPHYFIISYEFSEPNHGS